MITTLNTTKKSCLYHIDVYVSFGVSTQLITANKLNLVVLAMLNKCKCRYDVPDDFGHYFTMPPFLYPKLTHNH